MDILSLQFSSTPNRFRFSSVNVFFLASSYRGYRYFCALRSLESPFFVRDSDVEVLESVQDLVGMV